MTPRREWSQQDSLKFERFAAPSANGATLFNQNVENRHQTVRACAKSRYLSLLHNSGYFGAGIARLARRAPGAGEPSGDQRCQQRRAPLYGLRSSREMGLRGWPARSRAALYGAEACRQGGRWFPSSIWVRHRQPTEKTAECDLGHSQCSFGVRSKDLGGIGRGQ